MSREPSTSAMRDLRVLLGAGAAAGLSDAQLLRRYVDRRAEAEAAFGALVDRHGPMVWGVCRRALGAPEAEDAFQATFLVLARKADAVRVDGSLGRWLYGVASRIAARVRADRLRRPARERRAAKAESAPNALDPEKAELLAALDEELGRLPEKFRSPMVLCHLEGHSYASAADRLGCTPGAIKRRLDRGRELLRSRLARRGLGPPAPIVGAFPIPDPRPVVPTSLAESTARAAVASMRPATVAGASTSALALAKGESRTMFLIRWARWLVLLTPVPAGLGYLATQPAPVRETKTPASTFDDPKDRPSRAIVVPLPGRDDLHALLRRAAKEAIAVVSKEPSPTHFTLTTIASAQARAGDAAGARETFAAAVCEAAGDFGSQTSPLDVWRVGHSQAQAGFRDEARTTLRRAVEMIPPVIRNFEKDSQSLSTLSLVVREQAGLGDRDEAIRTAEQLKAFAIVLVANSEIGDVEATELASAMAPALAAVDDFEGAFRSVGDVRVDVDKVAGLAAVSAAKYLGRARARSYVEKAIGVMAAIGQPDRKHIGLGLLVEARALVGDIEGAKDSARSIGEGPLGAGGDLSDERLSAMFQIAGVQRQASQFEAARETLREAYRMAVDHGKPREPERQFGRIAFYQIGNGDAEGALRSIESTPEEVDRAWLLAQVARLQALSGKVEQARETMDRALGAASLIEISPPRANDLVPSPAKAAPGPRSDAEITRLAEIQAMAGDTAGALESLTMITDKSRRGGCLYWVVSALATAGDVNGALELAIKTGKTSAERRSGLGGVGGGTLTRLLLELPTAGEKSPK